MQVNKSKILRPVHPNVGLEMEWVVCCASRMTVNCLKGRNRPIAAGHQLSNSLRHLSSQNLVSVLRYPYKVVLNLKNRMTSVSVFHAATPFVQHIVEAKEGGSNLVIDN